jgi:hypothetical protein
MKGVDAMKHNWKLGIAFAAALVSGASPAASQMVGVPYRVDDGCAQELIQAVSLTSAQQATLDALRRQTSDAVKPILDQLKTLHQRIDTALEAGGTDPCAIGVLEIQGSSLRAQILAIQKNAEATFIASLSAEQQNRYAAFIAENPPCAAFPVRIWMLDMRPPHA